MSDDDGIGAIIGVVVVIGFIMVASFYAVLTYHTRTVTVKNKMVDVSKEDSHYLLYTTDGDVIELDRPWYGFLKGYNVDKLYLGAEINRTYTYDCYGLQLPSLYQYSVCYEEAK